MKAKCSRVRVCMAWDALTKKLQGAPPYHAILAIRILPT